GCSQSGARFPAPARVPGSGPVLPAAVTTTGPPAPDLSEPGPVATAPNQVTEARADSRMPAIPPAGRPCGRTAAAGNLSNWASVVMNTRSQSSLGSWTAPTTRSPGLSEITSNSEELPG